MEDRECHYCGSHKTRVNKKGIPYWNKNKPTPYFLCQKCFCHLFNYKYEKIRLQHLIRFFGLKIRLGWNPRKGFCSKCGTSKDGWKTHMHHWFYLRIMPWACTMELCCTCHNLIHEKGGALPWITHKRKISLHNQNLEIR